jgi:hypothetical protein
MSKSNWRHHLALGGLLVVGCLIAPAALGQPQEQVSAGNTEQAGPKENEPKFPTFGEREYGRARTYRTICKAPYNREYADLCQQWRVAEAAEKQVIAIWISNGALIFTLILTAVATWAASRAARAAEKAVEVTEGTAKQELRAYVDIKGGVIRLPLDHSEMMVRVDFSNYGQTPATNIRFWARAALLEPHEFQDREVPTAPDTKDVILSPTNLAFVNRKIALAPGDVEAFQAGRKKPYVWGLVEYTDIFGRPHSFEFKASNSAAHSFDKERGHSWHLWPTEGGYKST